MTYKTLTCNGETHTIGEWSRLTGNPYARIAGRLRIGWPVEEALGFKLHNYHHMTITYKGETHTAARWSEITGIMLNTIKARIKYGWPAGEALGYEHHVPRYRSGRAKKGE